MPALSPSLSLSPRADQWLRFAPEGVFELRTGKVELGLNGRTPDNPGAVEHTFIGRFAAGQAAGMR